MNKTISDAVESQAALTLAMAWINTQIETYDRRPGRHSLYFRESDFGNLFQVLGWPTDAIIKVTVELEAE